MKKILIIPSLYPSHNKYSGSFFRDQALFLSQNGFDVKVLMAEELHTKSYVFQVLKRIFYNKRNTLSTDFLSQNPTAYSFPLVIQKSWSERKKMNTYKERYKVAFQELLELGWRPDLIHAQNVFKAGIVAQYVCSVFDLPYVIIEHSPFRLKSYSSFFQDEIKTAFRKANKVAAVSRYQRDCLLRDGIERPIEVVWNLVDERKFIIPEKKQHSTFRIVTITYSDPVKDVTTFFKALAAFVEMDTYQDVQVIVVGNATFGASPDSDTSYFENIAAKLGVREICTFIPYATQTKIIQILQEAHVFVSTSIEETFGLAVREALLCGATVISTKSGGVEDTLNSSNSILVEVGDFNEIALHLEQIKKKQKCFDILQNRNDVISQSGRAKFLEAMTNFYTIPHD
ncbi:glycosyltransferase [Hanstruepera flava]|uniref:glycosyltransferase n=1 Tax=Hanstruepera flava TaxID=2930218 RepID=UPI002027C499|nr:glycosyltransferase [Hanstruepera flava]